MRNPLRLTVLARGSVLLALVPMWALSAGCVGPSVGASGPAPGDATGGSVGNQGPGAGAPSTGGTSGATSGSGGAAVGSASSRGATGSGGAASSGGATGTGGSGTGTGGTGAGIGTGTGGGASITGTGGSNPGMGLPCDVQTFLTNRCQTCHGATPVLGVPTSLVTYAELTGPSKSDPTKTEAEMAVSRMQNTTVPMPPKPGTPATAAEVGTMQAWIAAGYPTGSCAPPGGSADGGVPADGGASADGAGPGTAPDPFAVAATCTSGTMFKGGESAAMDPGMACVSCHAKSGEAPKFTIAGTVYPTGHEPDLCNGTNGSTGAQIVITGADGKSITLTPNNAGNFSSNGAVTKPYQAKVTYMGRERLMIAAQTSGDCNSCHTQTGANMAPGRIVTP